MSRKHKFLDLDHCKNNYWLLENANERLQKENQKLKEENASLRQRLDRANFLIRECQEFTNCLIGDLQHYLENQCLPTKDEINQAVIIDSELLVYINKMYIEELGEDSE